MRSWIVFAVFTLFWALLAPAIILVAWPFVWVLVVSTRGLPVPIWLKTPWDFLCHFFVWGHHIRIVDADGDDDVVPRRIVGARGAVLTNHRSWADFAFDPAQFHCAVIARRLAVVVCGIAGVMGILSGKVIMIQRGVTSRHEMFGRAAEKGLFLFYPEGTRRANGPSPHEPGELKIGGLKSIFEAQIEAHITITVGKEDILNEGVGRVGCGTTVYRASHPAIDAGEYEEFDQFLADVQSAWQETWYRAYALRDEHEGPTTAEKL